MISQTDGSCRFSADMLIFKGNYLHDAGTRDRVEKSEVKGQTTAEEEGGAPHSLKAFKINACVHHLCDGQVLCFSTLWLPEFI